MQVTSLKTSKCIYELTGWSNGLNWKQVKTDIKNPLLAKRYSVGNGHEIAMGYDLSYLLERLPPFSMHRYPEKNPRNLYSIETSDGMFYEQADNPTEAAGLLVIALAEAGILTKGSEITN